MADEAELKLSDWQQDYSWEATQKAIEDGYILHPIPEGWERVRDVAIEIGGRSAVSWLLGSGERPAQIVWDAGVYDRCRMDEYFELHCTLEDGQILRNYATPLWHD